jgi:potassium-transporting ATPase KdpC subunit
MKEHFLPSIKLTVVCLIFFSGIYTLIVYAAAQFTPNHGEGFIVNGENKAINSLLQKGYYYSNIGQSFTKDKYFWSRPSAVGYNAMGSGASNLAPSNISLIDTIIPARIDTFLKHNPGVNKADIPVDLLTASGSGLDPDISVDAAKIQVKRIAAIRGITKQKLLQLVDDNTEKPLWGLFGPSYINVLKLNIALDNLK